MTSKKMRTRLLDNANQMDAEDGLIWVYGVGDDGVMAFTDFASRS
jgi:hypothetical protein